MKQHKKFHNSELEIKTEEYTLQTDSLKHTLVNLDLECFFIYLNSVKLFRYIKKHSKSKLTRVCFKLSVCNVYPSVFISSSMLWRERRKSPFDSTNGRD